MLGLIADDKGLLLNIANTSLNLFVDNWLFICSTALMALGVSYVRSWWLLRDFEKLPLVGSDNTKLEAAIREGTKLVELHFMLFSRVTNHL